MVGDFFPNMNKSVVNAIVAGNSQHLRVRLDLPALFGAISRWLRDPGASFFGVVLQCFANIFDVFWCSAPCDLISGNSERSCLGWEQEIKASKILQAPLDDPFRFEWCLRVHSNFNGSRRFKEVLLVYCYRCGSGSWRRSTSSSIGCTVAVLLARLVWHRFVDTTLFPVYQYDSIWSIPSKFDDVFCYLVQICTARLIRICNRAW